MIMTTLSNLQGNKKYFFQTIFLLFILLSGFHCKINGSHPNNSCINKFITDAKNNWRKDEKTGRFIAREPFILNMDSIYSKCLINQDTSLLFKAMNKGVVIPYIPATNQNQNIAFKIIYLFTVENKIYYQKDEALQFYFYTDANGKILRSEKYIAIIDKKD